MARIVLDLGEGLQEKADLSLVATAFPGVHWPQSESCWPRRAVIQARSRLTRYLTLYRLLRAWRPEVVHSHQEAYAPLIARLASVPVRVETIHSAPFWRQLGHPLVRRLRRRAVHRHIVVSKGLREEIVARGELRPDEVTAIPNGVRVGEYRPPRDDRIAPVLGTVARFDEGKGLQFLARAFVDIRRRFPRSQLILAGDGPYRTALEGLLQELEVAEAVHLPGYVADTRMVLREMDIFVLPSLHEAFGLSLAEAMAEGLPVVATDLPGPASLCRHEREGLLVPPGDVAAITSACLRLMTDRALREHLSLAAYQRVRCDFSLDRMCRAHRDLYLSLLYGAVESLA